MESNNSNHLQQRMREEQEYIDDNGWDSDPYEALLSQCGMTGYGGCLYVGTEYCDWDCPFDSLEHFDHPDSDEPAIDPNQMNLFNKTEDK